ncbi:Uncharacterised protein [Candidatus Bartonella washoeensis]|nr:Uncharacterised protein [Bartonella washoeensis]
MTLIQHIVLIKLKQKSIIRDTTADVRDLLIDLFLVL